MLFTNSHGIDIDYQVIESENSQVQLFLGDTCKLRIDYVIKGACLILLTMVASLASLSRL